VVRIFLGVFLLFEGMGKIAWLRDSEPLSQTLAEWREEAPPASRFYLDAVAIPGATVFSRLVPLGEMGSGLALLLGAFTRLAALAAVLMVLNFHVASGALFAQDFLTNGYGLPVLGPLLALALGGSSPLSLLPRRR
jgi:uncharacterized membrane protein YphA (DoxX/SURF4 family)